MAGLNRELQASSLLECIVAAVILLASFMIATETLTRVTLTGDDPAENVSMESWRPGVSSGVRGGASSSRKIHERV